MKTFTPELLTVRDVAHRLRIGTRTVWKWTTAGHLPKPIRLGKSGRTVRWKSCEIDHFLQQLAERSSSRNFWDYLDDGNLRASD